jgi:hypothetical protein
MVQLVEVTMKTKVKLIAQDGDRVHQRLVPFAAMNTNWDWLEAAAAFYREVVLGVSADAEVQPIVDMTKVDFQFVTVE